MPYAQSCRARISSAFFSCALVAATAALPSSPAWAIESDRYSVSELGLNFDVPESPAFTVLDVNPQTVTRPATPRDFAAALINGLDRNGNFQSGVAIEFNVWGIYNRNRENPAGIGEYAKGPATILNYKGDPTTAADDNVGFNRCWRNLWYRTAFSFATTKGSNDDDESLRIAAGVRATPWDPGDARLMMNNCLVGKMRNLRDATDMVLLPKLKETAPRVRDHGFGEEANTIDAMVAQIEKYPDKIKAKCNVAGTGANCDGFETLSSSLAKLKRDLAIIWERADVREDFNPSDAIIALDEAASATTKDNLGELLQVVEGSVDDVTDSIWARFSAQQPQRVLAVEPDVKPTATPKTSKSSEHTPSDTEIAKATADTIIEDCRAEEKGRWNGSSWDLAFAPSWLSKDGSTGRTQFNGGAVWSSLALGSDVLDWTGDCFPFPWGKNCDFSSDVFRPDTPLGLRRNYGTPDRVNQFILHGRYRFRERAPEDDVKASAEDDDPNEPNTDFAKQNTWLVGLRYRALVPTENLPLFGTFGALHQRLGVSLEAALTSTDVTGNAKKLEDDTYIRWAVVPTFRITENTWIDVAFGTETGKKGDDETFVLTGIKYGYGEGPWPSHAEQNGFSDR